MTVLDQFQLHEKNIVVTGAGRGIGQALAVALAEAGARIALVGRDPVGAETTLKMIDEAGSEGVFIQADINTDEGVDKAVSETVSQLGSLDVLVNNAGDCIHKPALEVTREDYHAVMGINMESLFFLSQAAGKVMQKQGHGNIINVGSISAQIVNRPQWQPIYNSSKAAVHQLTKSLAVEWAPFGIRVNAIAPGYIKTEMSPVEEPQFKTRWIDDVPQQRYGMPDELGTAVVYLASEGSSFTTGSVLLVDGGYTLV
ncbi:glucose 1-dehydrogenase [Pontimonas sp.]|jgi:NAD(P)-dependent dehydrogenase (short-subunit alcohol dehydrogenase family)|uniref:SDR family NAD(P)-dependent oxidoreductase n=1 Tax=Pontimonas sp. TaxID=2304492 RepID=UPI00287017B1|nr:glucose 1-dehydrogenase [Pontimonas sp.]MDR9396976.1 SDR family oxidoreductase [Pontimonas sp.]